MVGGRGPAVKPTIVTFSLTAIDLVSIRWGQTEVEDIGWPALHYLATSIILVVAHACVPLSTTFVHPDQCMSPWSYTDSRGFSTSVPIHCVMWCVVSRPLRRQQHGLSLRMKVVKNWRVTWLHRCVCVFVHACMHVKPLPFHTVSSWQGLSIVSWLKVSLSLWTESTAGTLRGWLIRAHVNENPNRVNVPISVK